MAKFCVIILAAGKSSRFNDPHYKKPFAKLSGRAVWLHSAELFQRRSDVSQLIVVVAPEDKEEFLSLFGANIAVLGIDLVTGGEQRYESVANAVAKVNADIDYVAVHDAARPCIADEWIDRLFDQVTRSSAATLAIPVDDTLKHSDDGKSISRTVDRSSMWRAQTPQVFARELLQNAYQNRGQQPATDDCELVERTGTTVDIVRGSPLNLKITTKQDLALAGAILKVMPQPKFDAPAHPFGDDNLWR